MPVAQVHPVAPGNGDAAASFEPHRRRLAGLAYRMLGTVSDAEDVVQDAYLRWHAADRARVDNPRAFLSKTVVRLCLDQLKSARHRREAYVGPWLPEPLIEDASGSDASAGLELADDLSVALMMALERLSPLERAAFLLHDVFDQDFTEVAEAIGRNAAACRQLAARARRHVRSARPRFPVSRDEEARIAEAFLAASRGGDVESLGRLLAADATLVSDGGGRKLAALNPIRGRAKLLRFYTGLARKAEHEMPVVLHRGRINGQPGFVTVEPDGTLQTTVLDIRDGAVVAIYVVRNPEKLAHLGMASRHTG